MSSCWTGPSANAGKTEGLDTDKARTFTPHGAKAVSGMSVTTGWEKVLTRPHPSPSAVHKE